MEYQRITLRIPVDLHQQLMEKSEQKSRSMNAEIIARLLASLSETESEPTANSAASNDDEHIRRVAMEVVRQELARLGKVG